MGSEGLVRERPRTACYLAEMIREGAVRAYRMKTLRNRCFVVSYVFRGALKSAGFNNARLVGGTFMDKPHAWVEIDDRIWDLTLTQFVRKAEPISVLAATDPRYRRIMEDHPEDYARAAMFILGCEQYLLTLLKALQEHPESAEGEQRA